MISAEKSAYMRAWWRKNASKRKSYNRRFYTKHRTRIRAAAKIHYKQNREKVLTCNRKWAARHPEKCRKIRERWKLKYPEKHVAARKNWEIKNPLRKAINSRNSKLRNRDRINKDYRRRWKTDKLFNITRSLRCRILLAVRAQRTTKSGRTEQLLGCSITNAVKHIESLFLPGMSWANRGLWHVDHKRPCKAFDLTDPVQQRLCFHYTNLQPLWGIDNLRKGSKILA